MGRGGGGCDCALAFTGGVVVTKFVAGCCGAEASKSFSSRPGNARNAVTGGRE